MNLKFNLNVAAVFLYVVLQLFSSSASATTVDFGDNSFAPAEGLQTYSFSIDGITITLDALGGANPVLSHTGDPENDGFGINRDTCNFLFCGPDENDEIDRVETLLVTFSSPVNLFSFAVSDLFFEGIFGSPEVGYYDANSGGTTGSFSAQNANGLLDVNLGGLLVTTIAFSAEASNVFINHDYSLKGLTFRASNEVPEPASMLLLGSGLAGLVVARRRRFI